ncbi:MAG: RNase adapter RapZ [Clostridiales bacterium]|nr:RNase adapter RapZ [Clostridiales bacterium]
MIIEKKELIILTGISGAGKSTAISCLEDMNYYCIDNMPVFLLETFLELLSEKAAHNKIAIVIDVRTTENFESILSALAGAERYDYEMKVIYLDIKTPEALKRYKLTRRKHPFSDRFSGNIENAIAYERQTLEALRLRADHIIDTSELTTGMLKRRFAQILLGGDKDIMNIHIESFGFKFGIPTEADFVIDVRCLPNPYWLETLRDKTGLDREVKDYVFSFEEANELLGRLIDMLDFLNPLYIKEGRSQLVIAVGCTGGNHRSVAFAEALREHFSLRWDNVSVHHRDIDRK